MSNPPPYSARVIPPSSRFPHRFVDSNIAASLARIAQLLKPRAPGLISRQSRTAMGEYERRCAAIKAWHDLRATVYARVYPRTDDAGKQALADELSRIMGLVMSKWIEAHNLPDLLGGPTDARHPTVSDKYRAVLWASDGTIVGLLDQLRAIEQQRPEVRHVLQDLPAVCSVWEAEHAGYCPFWGMLTEDELHDAVSNLKNFVQSLESNTGDLGIQQSVIPAALKAMETMGRKCAQRRYRPATVSEQLANNRQRQQELDEMAPLVARLPVGHPDAALHAEFAQHVRSERDSLAQLQNLHDTRRHLEAINFHSLSNSLLNQPLSTRKARIYRMI
ncbi:hypothetical protein Rt10032_c17g5896 [Rhodotorula toruloides]|uniref:Uncharacterized protein n=1 Tax=Rhodotorula toruloides TaxID=5286 RepID=A0A511KND5_RHOTO|nr:hypothetical protein Rt10032_c17g5896 [Rhodotorula toruloides]